MTEPSRTTVGVDDVLLAAAADAPGTTGAGATVRAALERVVRGRRVVPDAPRRRDDPGEPPLPDRPGPDIPYPDLPRRPAPPPPEIR